jgi:hypothetical protein
MKAIRINYDNGAQIVTDINGSEESIRDYYIGHSFNIGNAERDVMTKAVSVEFIES